MKIAALLLLSLCLGCKMPPSAPTPKWNVNLVRPDGAVQKSWTVKSNCEPKIASDWGGTTQLLSDDGAGHHCDYGLRAPSGWFFDVSPVKVR